MGYTLCFPFVLHRIQVDLPSLLPEMKTASGFQQRKRKNKKNIFMYPTQKICAAVFTVFAVPCENRMHLGIVQVNLTLLLVFTVFATMMAEFQHETVLGFWPVRKFTFRHKAGRTGRQTKGLSHHEWGFCGFLSSKEVLHTSYFIPRTSSTRRRRRRSS